MAGAQAARADVYVLRCAVNDSLNSTDITLPGSVTSPVRMADLNAERYTLSANFTLCHNLPPNAL